MMEEFRYGGTFIALLRDHGHGRVDDRRERRGGPVRTRSPTSSTSRNTQRGDRGAGPPARGGRRARDPAAGRRRAALARGATTSTRSSRACSAIPLRAGGYRLFSAHQMGTCRMGDGPADQRRRTRGASCTTRKGVWIGDGSAFPTSSGTNPMISIMALAHRTAEAIAADAGAGRASRKRQPQTSA